MLLVAHHQREFPIAAGKRERTLQHVRLEILASQAATWAGKPGKRLTGTEALTNLEAQYCRRSLANMPAGPRVLISKPPSALVSPAAMGNGTFRHPMAGACPSGGPTRLQVPPAMRFRLSLSSACRPMHDAPVHAVFDRSCGLHPLEALSGLATVVLHHTANVCHALVAGVFTSGSFLSSISFRQALGIEIVLVR